MRILHWVWAPLVASIFYAVNEKTETVHLIDLVGRVRGLPRTLSGYPLTNFFEDFLFPARPGVAAPALAPSVPFARAKAVCRQ